MEFHFFLSTRVFLRSHARRKSYSDKTSAQYNADQALKAANAPTVRRFQPIALVTPQLVVFKYSANF
jgi:hypothetical protein